MTKGTLIAVTALVVLIAGVVLLGLDQMDRDRRMLTDRFALEQLQHVEQAGQVIKADLNRVASDLLFFGRLAEQAPEIDEGTKQVLEAMLAIVKEYEIVQLYGSDGQLVLEAYDPSGLPPGEAEAAAPWMTDVAAAALEKPAGSTDVTMPLMLATGHAVRIFSTTIQGPATIDEPDVRVVVLAVDTEPLFSKLRLASMNHLSRILFLGPNGKPSRLTDATIADKLTELDSRGLPGMPGFVDLVDRMRSGESGTLKISTAEALELGLPAEEAVAAFSAVRTNMLSTWSFATVSSTVRLRVYERGVFLRLGPMLLVIAVLLVGFGVYIVLEARRSGMLRQRLMLADRLGHLHEKMEKMVDNIPTGVLALSTGGRITMMNRMLREKIGTGVGGALSEAFSDAPRSVVDRLEALVAEATRTSRVQSLHGERMWLFGIEGQYSIHAVPLEARFDDARVLLVLEDQSEVRALSSQLIRAEKLATVGALAAGIAHEIGTPLGVIRGRAEYILGKLGSEHPQSPGMRVIVEQIDFVTRTIRQLLDFARVKPASVSPVQVAPIVQAVVDLLGYEAERRKLSLTTELTPELPPVAADADQLQQVLVALTVNAFDACAAGGHVTIRARHDDPLGSNGWRRLCLEVADDGSGISPEHRTQVFDPFFTTKKRGQGTGLGLTICAQIVRNHGGEIELDSEVGRGTRVIVRWPCARSQTSGEPRTTGDLKATGDLKTNVDGRATNEPRQGVS